MIYQERKKETGYEYKTESFFGSLVVLSPEKLNGEILDGMVSLLSRGNAGAGKISGTIKHKEGIVSYVLTRTAQWEECKDYDTDESWNDIPTSTKKQAKGSTRRSRLKIPILNWLLKFVVAFRVALKSLD